MLMPFAKRKKESDIVPSLSLCLIERRVGFTQESELMIGVDSRHCVSASDCDLGETSA